MKKSFFFCFFFCVWTHRITDRCRITTRPEYPTVTGQILDWGKGLLLVEQSLETKYTKVEFTHLVLDANEISICLCSIHKMRCRNESFQFGCSELNELWFRIVLKFIQMNLSMDEYNRCLLNELLLNKRKDPKMEFFMKNNLIISSPHAIHMQIVAPTINASNVPIFNEVPIQMMILANWSLPVETKEKTKRNKKIAKNKAEKKSKTCLEFSCC